MIATYMAVSIFLVAVAIYVVYFLEWRKVRNKPWAWILIAYSLIGLYWAILYFVVLLAPDGLFDPQQFGRIYVRPAFLVTLSVILAAALIGRDRP